MKTIPAKTKEAWAIYSIENGEYAAEASSLGFTSPTLCTYYEESQAIVVIESHDLKMCKPVKIRITIEHINGDTEAEEVKPAIRQLDLED